MGVSKRGLAVEGILNFCGLSREELEAHPPTFSVLPVPYDLTASYVSGTRNGPRAIIEAFTHMELYDDELGREVWEAGIETLPSMEPTALGPGEMVDRVHAAADEILDAGRVPVMLGGEHSVTLGLVRSLIKRYPKMSVLQLDAHADMRDSYQDTPFNHACIARRISEICPIVQVGIRSLSTEEAVFLDSQKKAGRRAATRIKTWYAAEVLKGVDWSRVVRGLTDEVFITVDLDVFDPAVMPATGTPEPGGLGWYDALGVLRSAAAGRKVVGFDVVELCPLPGNIAPDFLAAKLVYKMMGYATEGRAGRSARGPRKR
ncbi:MAG: agmatinase [Thermodesulfobacteriota bacterium]